MLEKAKDFAIRAHASINQRRKYTNEPYHVHCERVVAILSEVITAEDVLAAAWMHDVLEDVAPLNADYSEVAIREMFGDRICNMVLALTDSPLSVGNRATRKALDRERLATASIEVKSIKLADAIDNLIDIQKNDMGFAGVFARELNLMMPSLADGDAKLFSRLTTLLQDFHLRRK